MVGYILDTDTWIEYFHHRSGIGAHIAKISPEYIYASEVSIAELTYGALHSGNVEKHMREPQEIENSFKVLPIVKNWIADYAEIRHSLASQGLTVGNFDIIIGVTARRFGLTVVTHNTKHFSKMPGIQCVDWVNQ
ncbi:MAG: PIN domain-containing protein [Prevotella sp.]|nr:PIN domain-containing protein [Prevotella sp.]MBR6030970.1 PIN domain-containing protein [Bacteroidaceae bacterium]MBR6187574.1 PIN domain-containing protein [Prevotella sp.]